MRNLLLNKTATASGYISPYAPARAVNGNILPTNRWACKSVPSYIMVDMGESYWIDRWVVKSMGSVTGWTSPDYNMN